MHDKSFNKLLIACNFLREFTIIDARRKIPVAMQYPTPKLLNLSGLLQLNCYCRSTLKVLLEWKRTTPCMVHKRS